MKKRGELLTIRHRESSREVHATIQDEASFEIDQADEFCKYQWATLCELPGQTHHPLWPLSSGSPLGELQNIDHLSPHDLRHYWTYDALGNGTPINRVQSGGNWKSPVMVLRYAKRRGITNEGVLITE